MSIKINYKGSEIASVGGGGKATLNCKGKLMEDNVLVDASGVDTKDSDTLVELIEGTLTEIADDRVTKIRNCVFQHAGSLTSVNFPNVTNIGFYGFSTATKLTHANFPKANIIGSAAFENTSLSYFDAPVLEMINTNTFNGCAKLTRLFLRRTGAICTLSNVNAFNGTPFADGGIGGTVYVPRDLIESYQSGTNWSSLYSCRFVAIEDYTVDGTITGAIDNSLITFTIDGTTYNAEKGMTWGGWCNSEYNTVGFYCAKQNTTDIDFHIFSADGSKYVGWLSYIPENTTEEIVAGYKYCLI